VPVVQVTLPVPRSPFSMLALGAALAPFRDRGVLLLGTGGVVHNLRRLGDGESILRWAAAFDEWVAARLETLDVEALQGYATAAPHADLAVPTTEHLDPLFFVLGSRGPRDKVEPIYEGFRYGSLSLRSFAIVTP
jgi:4,5-DOPA dioxygenase extradiol